MKCGEPTQTTHRVLVGNSQKMSEVAPASVDLVVTSPPYPMIEMWDETFYALNDGIRSRMQQGDGVRAHELMHDELDAVWRETDRVLKDGAIACINIGDATRTIGDRFQLFPNHTRVTERFRELGFSSLPSIIWRKPTNAPNKFMGSGMLPPGAYVTLEHEHILVFRKGNKRQFLSDEQKSVRSESAYFWEERNLWFSDVWTDLRGVSQKLNHERARERSGAFPFELPYRLINMYSAKHDVVLDPFLGTGTTTLAAIASVRNSIGYEMDETLPAIVADRLAGFEEVANDYTGRRIDAHREFAASRDCEFVNQHHGFRCVSAQEMHMRFNHVDVIDTANLSNFKATYSDLK
ncbi:MAG: site-specific DNA-methyltransferase [Methanobacteriota archaeon]|nr:MAG: site-specific DNA-methyltransferase [Euryarchaeota archaeon]